MTFFITILAVVMTIMAVRVKKLVWQSDKIIPLMLVMMCCTLYSLNAFFILYNVLDYTILTESVCMEPMNVVVIIF